jgi:hypothetical protein
LCIAQRIRCVSEDLRVRQHTLTYDPAAHELRRGKGKQARR